MDISKDDVTVLFEVFKSMCDFIEENVGCDKCPVRERICFSGNECESIYRIKEGLNNGNRILGD